MDVSVFLKALELVLKGIWIESHIPERVPGL
jgi:hypothetical protein